jgi:hypothetical protein
MLAGMDDEPQATLYLDHGALKGEPLFTGSFIEAVKMVWVMAPVARSYARIETAEWSYDAGQIEDMRREDEGEI